MARKPRVHYPGALYHVILRGNAGQILFDDDQERTRLILLAPEGVERFGHRLSLEAGDKDVVDSEDGKVFEVLGNAFNRRVSSLKVLSPAMWLLQAISFSSDMRKIYGILGKVKRHEKSLD